MKQKKTTCKQTVDQKNVPEVASFLIIVFALLYTAGWSFAYHYFGHFNVGLSALELPKEDYFIYSYWVIADHKGLLFYGVLSLLVVTWGLVYTIRQWVTHSSTRFYLLLMIMPIAILTLFAISYRLGTSSADIRFKAQKADFYPAYPSIEIFQTKGASPKQLTQSLTSGCYRQLIQNKDKVFVFKPIKSVPQLEISTLVIPISQVHAMRLLPMRKRCD
ncbi:conserved hypothetical protein, membrane [Candidatus Magnetomorum sp. HK-1]|nr:conserved hypothetical protein, membrane [Candidatus Magnetomorum sp. HK-1]